MSRLPIVDSHAHVFAPGKYPLRDTGGHMPLPLEQGTGEQYLRVLDSHGVSHALLVNPQAGYGLDNRALLDAIALGRGRFRGVALIAEDISDRELAALAAGGVVGARFNLLFAHATRLRGPTGERLLRRIAELGWFAQIYYRGHGLTEVLPLLKSSGVRVVIDHCGGVDVGAGLQQEDFQALLALGRDGNAAVKLSGAFRLSSLPWPHRDLEPYISKLLEAFTPQACMWGSDWPFVRFPARTDYGPQLDWLRYWVPDRDDQRAVLWTTPRRWLGFSDEPAQH